MEYHDLKLLLDLSEELALHTRVLSRGLLLEQEKIPAAYANPRILASVARANLLFARSSRS